MSSCSCEINCQNCRHIVDTNEGDYCYLDRKLIPSSEKCDHFECEKAYNKERMERL